MAVRAIGFETGDESAGGAGLSTQTSPAKRVKGVVLAVGVTYNGSPPGGTTDLTIQTTGTVGPARTILAITDAATDGWFDLAAPVVNNDASTPNYNDESDEPVQRMGIPVDDEVEVVIAQANDDDGASVILLVQD